MWRKQPEPGPSSSETSPRAVPAPPPRLERPAVPEEPRRETTRISKGTKLKGEITGREDLFLDGEIEGSVRVPEASVTVGPNGRVTADVEAQEIVVEGVVKGNLRGGERVRIGRSGSVAGDVEARRIVIEEGAYFRGRVSVVRAEPAPMARAARAAAGAGWVQSVRAEAPALGATQEGGAEAKNQSS